MDAWDSTNQLPKTIRNKNSKRTEYWCSTYIRYGKEHCGSHALREEYLDEIIIEELRNTKQQYQRIWDAMQHTIDQWTLKQPALNHAIAQLREEIRQYEEEIDELLLLRIQSTK